MVKLRGNRRRGARNKLWATAGLATASSLQQVCLHVVARWEKKNVSLDGQEQKELRIVQELARQDLAECPECIIERQARVNMRLGEWAPPGQLTSACRAVYLVPVYPCPARHCSLGCWSNRPLPPVSQFPSRPNSARLALTRPKKLVSAQLPFVDGSYSLALTM